MGEPRVRATREDGTKLTTRRLRVIHEESLSHVLEEETLVATFFPVTDEEERRTMARLVRSAPELTMTLRNALEQGDITGYRAHKVKALLDYIEGGKS